MENFIFAFLVIGLGIALMAVRIIFIKNGEFRGTCSSQNQALKDVLGVECGVCGKKAGEPCGMPNKE